MARAYYSTVLPWSAPQVWGRIRDFGSYGWAAPDLHAVLEEGRPGDAVGSVRVVTTSSGTIRQRLLAHSDPERSYTYCFAGESSYPVQDYQATLRVTPVVDGDRAFVEWWATFDADGERRGRMVEQFQSSFAGWLGCLRDTLPAEER